MLDATRRTARRPLAALGALLAAMALVVGATVAVPTTADAAPAAEGFRLVAPDGSALTDVARTSAVDGAPPSTGAYASIKHVGKCTLYVSTTSPDRYRSGTLQPGQYLSPGFRVGRVAAPAACKVVVGSLVGTSVVQGKGLSTWVTLPKRTEGNVRIETRR